MQSRTAILLTILAVDGLISSGCFMGGYLPNALFNDRSQKRVCHVYYSILSEWYHAGSITKMSYMVYQEIRPNTTDCWQKNLLARFDDEKLARAYADQYKPYYRFCYWDPNNSCTSYWDLADTVVVFWVGIIFASIFLLAALMAVSIQILEFWRINRKKDYINLEGTEISKDPPVFVDDQISSIQN